MEKINCMTFNKEQRKLLPKLVELINEGNDLNDDPDFDIRLMFRKEEELVIAEGADCFECNGITYVDYNHTIVPDKFSPIYLRIEEDAKYHCNIGEDLHLAEIDGGKLNKLIKDNQNGR